MENYSMSSNHTRHRINITPENKIHFWSIFSTAIVGLFSLWIGITIQDDINTKNARETQKLARYQMTEAIYPKFVQYVDTCGYVFYDLLEFTDPDQYLDQKTIVDSVGAYYSRERGSFTEAMSNSVNFLCDNQYYLGSIFGKESHTRICKNNASILFGLRLLSHRNKKLFHITKHWQNTPSLQDSITLELRDSYYAKNVYSYRKEACDGILENYMVFYDNVAKQGFDSTQIVNNAVYQFIFAPYFDNFNVYSQELVPSEDVKSHIWKHLLLLVGSIVLGLALSLVLLKRLFGIDNFFVKNNDNTTEDV